jgi:hypothetical protein
MNHDLVAGCNPPEVYYIVGIIIPKYGEPKMKQPTNDILIHTCVLYNYMVEYTFFFAKWWEIYNVPSFLRTRIFSRTGDVSNA